MADVKVEFTGQAEQLEQTILRLERKIGQLEGKLKDTKRTSKEAFDPSSLAGFAGGLAGIVSVGGAITAAFALAKREIEATIQLQKEAKTASITLDAAHQGVLGNLTGRSRADKSRALDLVKKIAGDTKVDEKYIAEAMSQALGASGGNIDASAAAVRHAARMQAHAPEAIPRTAGSLLDLKAVTGTDDPRVNAGLLGAVAGVSRTVQPEQQARNIPRAMVGLAAQGATGREAGAAFGALSTSMKDAEGAITSSAMISLGKQLNAFFVPGGAAEKVTGGLGEADRFELERIRGKGSAAAAKAAAGGQLSEKELSTWKRYESLLEQEKTRKVTPAIPDVKGFTQQIEALQASPALRKAFVSGASFEAAALGPITGWISDANSEAARLYKENLQLIPTDQKELGRIADESLAAQDLSPHHATARVTRAFASGSERLMTEQPELGMAGAVREGVVDLIRKSGQNDLISDTERWLDEATTKARTEDPLGNAIARIDERRSSLLHPYGYSGPPMGTPGGVGGGPMLTPRDPNETEKRQAELLEQVIAELRAIRNSTDRVADQRPGGPALGRPSTQVQAQPW